MTWKASIAVHAQDLRNQGITASDKTVENWVSLGVNTLREKRTRGRPLHELALPVGKLVQIANELGGMAPSNAGSPSTLSELVVRVCRCCWVLKKMLVLLLLTGVSILSLPFHVAGRGAESAGCGEGDFFRTQQGPCAKRGTCSRLFILEHVAP